MLDEHNDRAKMSAGLPTTLEDIHRRSLDRRGRPVKGPLPKTYGEIHAIALERNRSRH